MSSNNHVEAITEMRQEVKILIYLDELANLNLSFKRMQFHPGENRYVTCDGRESNYPPLQEVEERGMRVEGKSVRAFWNQHLGGRQVITYGNRSFGVVCQSENVADIFVPQIVPADVPESCSQEFLALASRFPKLKALLCCLISMQGHEFGASEPCHYLESECFDAEIAALRSIGYDIEEIRNDGTTRSETYYRLREKPSAFNPFGDDENSCPSPEAIAQATLGSRSIDASYGEICITREDLPSFAEGFCRRQQETNAPGSYATPSVAEGLVVLACLITLSPNYVSCEQLSDLLDGLYIPSDLALAVEDLRDDGCMIHQVSLWGETYYRLESRPPGLLPFKVRQPTS